MRKLIIATAALAFISSTAFAQTSTTPATGGDTMSKGDTMKKAPKKAKKPGATGKSSKAPGEKGVREGSKTETILELLKRPGGVTSKELMKATGWQPHSVRGFLSGTVGKKMGLTVMSTKSEDKERNYSVRA